MAAAAMAQDEIGHARSFYPLLRDVAGPSPENEAETRTAFTNAEFLNQPFHRWTDFIAANFLFDTALTVLLESARESSFHDLAVRARRILEEEPLHWLHAEGWTRRLAAKAPAVKDALRSSFDSVRPDALRWFDMATQDLVASKVLARDADELRRAYADRVNRVLHAVGLADQ